MKTIFGILTALYVSLFAASGAAQTPPNDETPKITLSVPSGAPLRLYSTKRVSKRVGVPVQAKVMETVFSFDREVIPTGTLAEGTVTRVIPVSKWQRFRTILNGDFTPLRKAEIEFTSLTLSDGRKLSIHTVET